MQWHIYALRILLKTLFLKFFQKFVVTATFTHFLMYSRNAVLWKKEIVVGNKFFTRVLSLYNILYHENILSIILYLLTIYYIISHENIPHEDFPDWLKS